MATAQLFSQELAAGSTASATRDFLRDLLVNKAGWTHVKSYASSSDQYAVFTVPNLSGYVYIDVLGTALYIGTATTFDSTNNTLSGSKASTGNNNITIASSSQSAAITLIVHSEVVMIQATIGSNSGRMAWLFPLAAKKPTWWSTTDPFCILLSGTQSLNTVVGYVVTAKFGVTGSNSARLGGRQLTLGIVYSTTTEYFGQSSVDLGTMSSTGRAVLDTEAVNPGVEEYLVIDTSSEGIVVRSV